MKTAYINGFILDGTKDMKPMADKAILVEDGIITNITDKENISVNSGYNIVDLKGKYILPGLINLHVHLAGSGKPKKKATDPKKSVKLITSNALMRCIGRAMVSSYAKTELFSGTTTIRTVGGIADFDTSVRDSINNGKKTGPRILASNMAISVPGGHMAGSLGYEANSAKEASDFVDLIAKEKPDLIKLMITGGVMDAEVVGEPGVLRMPPELVKAACDRAHELGFKVAAHVESPKGVEVAVYNGVDSIEHGAKPDEDIVKAIKERGAFQVCTLSPAVPYGLFDRSINNATYEQQANGKIVLDGVIDMAKALLANDIPVGLGTDTACPFVTHYNMWRELALFIKYCDVSNAFAIYTATSLNATLAGVGKETGTIECGKSADMIVVEKNPLEDIRALSKVDMVVMRGRLYRDPKVKKFAKVERILDEYM